MFGGVEKREELGFMCGVGAQVWSGVGSGVCLGCACEVGRVECLSRDPFFIDQFTSRLLRLMRTAVVSVCVWVFVAGLVWGNLGWVGLGWVSLAAEYTSVLV